jgi:prolyl oligopeptidase
MCPVISPPPVSPVVPVTDVLHGVPITDPYRWLEDQNSPETRAWIEAQSTYTRAYLDAIPGRERIRNRVRELLDVETFDSFLKCGNRYFFRKRLPGQEQPSIYVRETANGPDELLVDPATRGTGDYTAVKPLRVSPGGDLLLYEVKQGGERTGTFEIFDVKNRRTLPDSLPRGFLRGFTFTPSCKSFYYVHEPTAAKRPFYRAVFHHVLGTSFAQDQEIFCAGDDEKLRLVIVPGQRCLGLLVYRFLNKTSTDFYLLGMGENVSPVQVLRGVEYNFVPHFVDGRILAMTDQSAPNRRIVEVQPRKYLDALFFDVVPEDDRVMRNWKSSRQHILVTYSRAARSEIEIFDSFGKHFGQLPCPDNETLRILGAYEHDDEILVESESFTSLPKIIRYSLSLGTSVAWAQRGAPLNVSSYAQSEVSFLAKDETRVPMYLVARRDVLDARSNPTIMTSYGGYGVSMTPQFSVFVAFLLERGCLFALPNIRGGSEFGAQWHEAAKRRNRQTAYDDFLSAADWLIKTGRTATAKLAIFGGSNSGLLVGAALTQRPDLFCAVVCMVPMLDMLRYHLFDKAYVWKEEFGTAEDPDDFAALAKYSPYQQVRDNVAYPSTMIVSGDADQNCNPLHARKMTARLQAANSSGQPIFLDYSRFRGHSPVLPLSVRIEALTDRLAFFARQLELAV